MRKLPPIFLIKKRLREHLLNLIDHNNLLNEENKTLLTEILDKKIETKYDILNLNDGGLKYIAYRFKTNSGNEYDIDFYPYYLNLTEYIILDGGETVYDNIKHIGYNNLEPTISLGFTPIEVKDLDIELSTHGTMDDPYIKRTNRNEQYEVLGKVSFLFDEFIKNNPNVKIFTIGKNTYDDNLKTYLYLFKNLFKDSFIFLDTKEEMFFVKK